jgi:hypothetical protein
MVFMIHKAIKESCVFVRFRAPLQLGNRSLNMAGIGVSHEYHGYNHLVYVGFITTLKPMFI